MNQTVYGSKLFVPTMPDRTLSPAQERIVAAMRGKGLLLTDFHELLPKGMTINSMVKQLKLRGYLIRQRGNGFKLIVEPHVDRYCKCGTRMSRYNPEDRCEACRIRMRDKPRPKQGLRKWILEQALTGEPFIQPESVPKSSFSSAVSHIQSRLPEGKRIVCTMGVYMMVNCDTLYSTNVTEED